MNTETITTLCNIGVVVIAYLIVALFFLMYLIECKKIDIIETLHISAALLWPISVTYIAVKSVKNMIYTIKKMKEDRNKMKEDHDKDYKRIYTLEELDYNYKGINPFATKVDNYICAYDRLVAIVMTDGSYDIGYMEPNFTNKDEIYFRSIINADKAVVRFFNHKFIAEEALVYFPSQFIDVGDLNMFIGVSYTSTDDE